MPRPFVILAALVLATVASSCQSVSIADQGTLSKSAMSFDEAGARSADCGLTTQIERGRSLTNASGAGGCASCH